LEGWETLLAIFNEFWTYLNGDKKIELSFSVNLTEFEEVMIIHFFSEQVVDLLETALSGS